MATETNPPWPGREFQGYGKDGIDPKWPNGALICVSICLNYEEGGEYEVRLGDAHSETYLGEIWGRRETRRREPSIETEFEYGARAGVWRILRMLEELKLKCTVWGVGKAIERNEDVAKEMIKAGHEIAGHGYRWIDYSRLTAEEEAPHIGALIDGVTRAAGKPPVGHYVGRHSLNTLQLLTDAHKARGIPFKYSSDSYGDDLPYWVKAPGGGPNDGLLMIPYCLDNNDFKFALPNGFSSPDDFYSYLRASFDYLIDEGRGGRPMMMSIGLHARVALRRFLEYIIAQHKGEIWVATREEIADHWIKTHPFVSQA